MVYPLYLFLLSIAPGTIWLFYFLRKDKHPEPKRMILKIFFFGMISAIPAAFIELFLQQFYKGSSYVHSVLTVALIEESLKYLVVRIAVYGSSELDEPMDILLYMIISALGFATLENMLIFLSPDMFSYSVETTMSLAAFRFISATFLHALTSGALGFFLALAFCYEKKGKILVFIGFAIAILLHALYDFSIINLVGDLKFEVPTLVIGGLAIFLYWGIRYLRSKKGLCKI